MIDSEYFLTEQDIIVTKTDRNGLITYVNDDLLRITGYSERELMGEKHNIFKHPDMPAEVFKDLWKTILNECTWRGVVKNKTKDGGFYWVHADVTPLYENKTLIGFMSVRVKPTSEEIKKAEKAYAQIKAGTFTDELVYGEIIKRDALNHLQRDFNDISVSTKFAMLVGLSIFAVILLAALDHTALNRLNTNHQQTLAQIQSQSHQVNLDYEAKIKTLEHKIALLDSQHTLETATLNKKTKGDTLLNEQFYKIKTYSNQALSDVQNRNIFIVLVALVVLVFLYELIIRSIAGPLKETQEGLRELSNGVYRIPIHYRSKNELGKMMEALRTASVRLGFDIANEKKISNQIIKMHEQNQLLNAQVNQLQRLESIARITAGIAHNFNNSLGAIMGFNQLNQYAADDCQDETIKQEIIENTKQVEIASLRSMELVKQMMAYTNQNSAHKRNEFKPTSLVIEEVCNIVRLDLASNVKMESDIDHEVTIQIDADNLRQILTHIIFNARDAMQNQGGLIAMSLNKMIAHEFVCSSCLKTFNGVFIELRIQDNGTGIEEQIITHIFDPFFTLKPAGQGMGLGLTTVSGLVHEALGHIIVETNTTVPRNGTTFRLLFPQG